jgi:hypothetical protein
MSFMTRYLQINNQASDRKREEKGLKNRKIIEENFDI